MYIGISHREQEMDIAVAYRGEIVSGNGSTYTLEEHWPHV